MADITILTNAFLIDCTGAEPMEGAAVVIEGGLIRDVVPSGRIGPVKGRVETLDLQGHTLMPGLTDAHVHICAVDANITDQHRHMPPSLIAAKSLKRLEQALLQGFTTVRDAGGPDYGFREAVNHGIVNGPRLLVSGRYLSQSGGHGDKRRRAEWVEPVECCIGIARPPCPTSGRCRPGLERGEAGGERAGALDNRPALTTPFAKRPAGCRREAVSGPRRGRVP